MPIVLSQRIDTNSDYEDVPFVVYHYPKRYRNQIKTGDIFLYYQGDRYKKENRYYFGCGVIGQIESSENGEEYYAHILEGKPFSKTVPIYHPRGGFYESVDFEAVRHKEIPAWQNSIRKISGPAYMQILDAAQAVDVMEGYKRIEEIEQSSIRSPLDLLKTLNQKYRDFTPLKKDRVLSAHLDRGHSVTDALKQVLGAKCQICNWVGFQKEGGDRYIEAHHLKQLALGESGSLCSDNIILVCPNCHREIHNGKILDLQDRGSEIHITLADKQSRIHKNTIPYLESLVIAK